MATYDWQISGNWVEIYETIFIPAMIGEWAPRVMALARPKMGEAVLDVACGTGVLTRLAGTAVGPTGQVVGLDISPDMLAAARKLPIEPRYSAPIAWREGDANALPFADRMFDVVFCQLGMMFWWQPCGK